MSRVSAENRLYNNSNRTKGLVRFNRFYELFGGVAKYRTAVVLLVSQENQSKSMLEKHSHVPCPTPRGSGPKPNYCLTSHTDIRDFRESTNRN